MLPCFPIRHVAIQKTVESRPMVGLPDMAELVHDDVVNARHRSLHQLQVQQDDFVPGEAAPATDHLSHLKGRSSDLQGFRRFKTKVYTSLEHVVCPVAIPPFQQSLNLALVVSLTGILGTPYSIVPGSTWCVAGTRRGGENIPTGRSWLTRRRRPSGRGSRSWTLLAECHHSWPSPSVVKGPWVAGTARGESDF